MKTVYCIGFEDDGQFVADWYERMDVRDECKLTTGAAKEIYFDFTAPLESTSDQITAMVDDMAWFKFTFPHKECQVTEDVES